MKPLDAGAILRLSEAGHVLPPWQMAVLLAGEAAPELAESEVRALPVGERDRLILRLRQAMFGEDLKLALVCPQCSARLEANLSVSGWMVPTAAKSFSWGHRQSRLPSTEDLVAALESPVESAGQILFARCVEDAADTEEAPTVERWLRSVQEHDPGADLHFETSCESCQHRWTLPLDPATFVWKEMQAVASRLISEVDRLASRYGWSEAEILALPARRRRAYLECES